MGHAPEFSRSTTIDPQPCAARCTARSGRCCVPVAHRHLKSRQAPFPVDSLQPLLSALYILLHWRVLVCLAASIGVAVVLSHTAWAAVPQLILLALAGAFPGLVWQARAETGTAPTHGPTSTPPRVQHAAGFLAGAVWGAASAASWPSLVVGAIVLVIVGGAWHHHTTVIRSWLSAASAAQVLRSVTLGFGASAIALWVV